MDKARESRRHKRLKSPKQKGTRGETAVVKLLAAHGIPARRQPLSGAVVGLPHDVLAWIGDRELSLEVKTRANPPALLTSWKKSADALVIISGERSQRPKAVVCLELDTLADILVQQHLRIMEMIEEREAAS